MDTRGREGEHEPGRLLREAREAAGLSRAELAELARVSRVSVREAELGRDARAGTLLALLSALPSLAPGDLIPSGRAAVPPAHPAVWSLIARAQGLRVARLARRLIVDGAGARSVLELKGVRPARGRFTGREGLLALMRTVAAGSSALLARLRARPRLSPGESFALEDGDDRHEFRIAPAGRRGFDYRVSRPAAKPWTADGELPETDLAPVVELPVEVAVETMELSLEGEGPWRDRTPVARARPSSLTSEDEPDPLSGLHRRGGDLRLTAGSKALRLRIDRPCVGVTYSLGCAGRASEFEPVASEAPGNLAELLRRAREDAGLSRRAVAERMGVSAMTIVEAERGREPRRSTMDRWAAALPELSSWRLLPFEGEIDRRVAWEHGRALHGCAAELEAKTVRISAEGHSELRIETEGLRRLREGRGELRVRLGHARSVLQASHARMRGMEAGPDDESEGLRISRVPGGGGPDLHELRIPAGLAERGASFTRKLEHRGVYVMTAGRARELTGQEGPFEEGASFGALLPTRVLRLVVKLPRGWWPEELRAHAWPLTQTPEPDLPDASTVLHPEGLEVEIDRRRRRAVLEVEHPLVGFKYAMSWRLPE